MSIWRKLAACGLAILVLVATFCLACAEEEEAREVAAQFVGVPTTGTAPLEVSFADQSEGDVTSWEWDFNNDGIVDSTQQNPTYEFTLDPECGCTTRGRTCAVILSRYMD